MPCCSQKAFSVFLAEIPQMFFSLRRINFHYQYVRTPIDCVHSH